MLTKLPDGTKCTRCNRIIQYATSQYNDYTCQRCGSIFTLHEECAQIGCPKCGGYLKNDYVLGIIY